MGIIIDATATFKKRKNEINLGEGVSINIIKEYNEDLYDILDFSEFDAIEELLLCDPRDLRRIAEFNEKLYGELLFFLEMKGFTCDNLVGSCPYNFAEVMHYYIKAKENYLNK